MSYWVAVRLTKRYSKLLSARHRGLFPRRQVSGSAIYFHGDKRRLIVRVRREADR